MTTRRTILTGLALAPVAAVPAVAARSPDERIEAACAEIRQALIEKYGWRVNVQNEPVPLLQYVPGGPDKFVGYHRHVVIIDADSERYGIPSRIRWWADDSLPLFAGAKS